MLLNPVKTGGGGEITPPGTKLNISTWKWASKTAKLLDFLHYNPGQENFQDCMGTWISKENCIWTFWSKTHPYHPHKSSSMQKRATFKAKYFVLADKWTYNLECLMKNALLNMHLFTGILGKCILCLTIIWKETFLIVPTK